MANKKLTEKQVKIIRLLHPRTSMRQLAERYGVDVSTVWRAIRGKHWVQADGPINATTRPYKRHRAASTTG